MTSAHDARAWACTQLALGPYTIVQQFAIPLQIQPQAFAFFSAVSWAQCLHYGREMPISHAAVCFVALLAVLAGAQVGSVFGLRVSMMYNADVISEELRSQADRIRLAEQQAPRFPSRFSDT